MLGTLRTCLVLLALVMLTGAPARADARDSTRVMTLADQEPSMWTPWGSWRLRVSWTSYQVATDIMWHPRLVARRHGSAREVVLWEGTNDTSVYWGNPMRVTWRGTNDRVRVRMVEISGLGAPAYAACLDLDLVDGQPRLVAAAEPGRDGECPAWATKADLGTGVAVTPRRARSTARGRSPTGPPAGT